MRRILDHSRCTNDARGVGRRGDGLHHRGRFWIDLALLQIDRVFFDRRRRERSGGGNLADEFPGLDVLGIDGQRSLAERARAWEVLVTEGLSPGDQQVVDFCRPSRRFFLRGFNRFRRGTPPIGLGDYRRSRRATGVELSCCPGFLDGAVEEAAPEQRLRFFERHARTLAARRSLRDFTQLGAGNCGRAQCLLVAGHERERLFRELGGLHRVAIRQGCCRLPGEGFRLALRLFCRQDARLLRA